MKRRHLFLAVAALAAVAASDVRAQQKSVIDEIKERGTLVVGLSTFRPWAMRSKTGDLIGYEIDVAEKLAEDMGVKVEFVPTEWAGIIPALLAKRFDMIISGMTITTPRNLQVAFTAPYSATGVHFVAHKKLAENLKKLEDYNDAKVTITVRRGTSAAVSAQRLFPKATLRQFDDDAQAIQEVKNGRAHALIGTVPRPLNFALDDPETLFIPFAEPFVKQADAMALRRGDPDALNFFNNWIMLKTMDGFLEERQAYWFKSRPWLDQVAL
jgi:polar amino acid transport system substrate-binding protein